MSIISHFSLLLSLNYLWILTMIGCGLHSLHEFPDSQLSQPTFNSQPIGCRSSLGMDWISVGLKAAELRPKRNFWDRHEQWLLRKTNRIPFKLFQMIRVFHGFSWCFMVFLWVLRLQISSPKRFLHGPLSHHSRDLLGSLPGTLTSSSQPSVRPGSRSVVPGWIFSWLRRYPKWKSNTEKNTKEWNQQ